MLRCREGKGDIVEKPMDSRFIVEYELVRASRIKNKPFLISWSIFTAGIFGCPKKLLYC